MWIEMFELSPAGLLKAMSCHVCGMWIEILVSGEMVIFVLSCHVCGMWIEM